MSFVVFYQNFKGGIKNTDNFNIYPTHTALYDDMEHISLWHDINNESKFILAADIIIVGNSRTQMCFSHTIRQKAAERNLTIYNFGSGCNESFEFFKKYVDKYNIKNKILLIGMNYGIVSELSGCSKNALSLFPTTARALYTARMICGYARGMLPGRNKNVFLSQLPNTWVFRACQDGLWYTQNMPYSKNFEIVLDDSNMVEEYDSFLQDLIPWCKKHNFYPFLFLAPGNDDNPLSVSLAVKKHNIPLFYFGAEQFKTLDQSHFNPESANLFTDLLFEQLDSSKKFQQDLEYLKTHQ